MRHRGIDFYISTNGDMHVAYRKKVPSFVVSADSEEEVIEKAKRAIDFWKGHS